MTIYKSGIQNTITKSVEAVDEWAEIAQNAVREGAEISIPLAYEAALHIDMALSTETAHTGTKIEVQVSSNSSGNEDWTTLLSFIGPTGTAASEAITNNPLAAGSTTATCAATAGFDADETRWIFIEDATVANSELCLLVSHVLNTSVTWQDGTTNAHVQNTLMYNIANTYAISLPMWVSRARVIYDNTYDSDGSTVHTKCRLSKVT